MEQPQPSRGHKGARLLGWWIGILTILGTGVLIYAAVTTPPGQRSALLEKPARVCPPQVSVPPRAVGFPVDDVLGVRPGMNARDVEETIKCVSEEYAIEKRDLPMPSAGKRKTRPLLRVSRGPDTLSFALFGPPGMEQVAASWREAYFDAGVGPPVASVEGALMQQYGAPHEVRDAPDGARILMWTYAPDGRPIRVKGKDGDIAATVTYMAAGWNSAACIKNARTDPLAPPAWDGRCGLTIRAEIDPSLADKSHTTRWRVVVLDQATLRRTAAEMRALGSATPP